VETACLHTTRSTEIQAGSEHVTLTSDPFVHIAADQRIVGENSLLACLLQHVTGWTEHPGVCLYNAIDMFTGTSFNK